MAQPRGGMMSDKAQNVIELRVEQIAQLFHTLDPFPFRERDLDQEVEEYIVGWAREMSPQHPFKIVVHVPESQTKLTHDLQEALRHYFQSRAAVLQGDLNELFRIGRRSLAIGVSILLACLFVAHFAAGYLAEAPFSQVIKESLLILGWVANWRPLEIFLYDWWPLARRRDLYIRLSTAVVEQKPYLVDSLRIDVARAAQPS
jgi:hypothetical protein